MKKRKITSQYGFNTERVFLASSQPLKTVYSFFQTSHKGLTNAEAEKRLGEYGPNEVQKEKKNNPLTIW